MGIARQCCAARWAGLRRAGSYGKDAPQRKVELTPWEQAEQGREDAGGDSGGTRTKADYAKAMDGFRAIYHDAPADVHAPSA